MKRSKGMAINKFQTGGVNLLNIKETTMNNIREFNHQKEYSITKFFPSKQHWHKTLSPIERFNAPFFGKGCLYFKGKVELEKFLIAMQNTLDSFDFIFTRFHQDEKGLMVRYSDLASSENSEGVQLEIEYSPQLITSLDENSCVPQKVDQKVLAGFTTDLEGLMIGAFKLTVCEDGFVIGFILNHAFFDQSSIVYFFKYLSAMYSNDKNNIVLRKPMLVEDIDISQNQISKLEDVAYLRRNGVSLGYQYIDDLTKFMNIVQSPYSGIVLDLHFITTEFEALKNSSSCIISNNDIMHAILFKIHALNPELLPDNNLKLFFLCNMRKRLGFGHEVIGNYQCVHQIDVNINYIRQASLLELAKYNRDFVSKINTEKYINDLMWYKCFFELGQTSDNYCLVPIVDTQARGISNLTSFSYADISFNGVTPVALYMPSLATFGFSLVCFDKANPDSYLNFSIGVPKTCLEAVIEFGKTTNLFRTKIVNLNAHPAKQTDLTHRIEEVLI